jgi:dethiobiotin synthetase
VKPTPRRLVVVVGTGTEVGKTWVSAKLLRELRSGGLSVAARKPVQSYEPGDVTDADVLAEASGEEPTAVCPPSRSYEVPMAPPMAADQLGRPPFTLTDLVSEIAWPEDLDLGLVETAGGVRSPLAADDADAVALTAALVPDLVVLVADAGLGTLNVVRLTCDAFEDLRASRDDLDLVVVLNRFDPSNELHQRNAAWLRDHDELDVITEVAELARHVSP